LAVHFLKRGWRIALPIPMCIATAQTFKFSVRSPRKLLTQKVQSERHRGRRIPITKCDWGRHIDMFGFFSQNSTFKATQTWVTDEYLRGCSCMCFLAHGGI
jgi:hypothetical protein